MSYDEAVPTNLKEWFEEFDTDDSIDKYFRTLTRHLLAYHHERLKFHDRNGYFAELAYEPKCLALGHERSRYEEDGEELEPVDDDQLIRDGDHERGFGGETICPGTRYGTCCTECEGYCEYENTGGNLWALPGVRVPSSEEKLIALAFSRVDENYRIVSHGEVGEPSNGALIVRLAKALKNKEN